LNACLDELYAWLTVFVLPINSAVNPLIYTVMTPSFKRRLVERRRSQATIQLNADTTRPTWFSSLLTCPWLRRFSKYLLAQLLNEADENLFNNIRYNPTRSLHYLLPKQTERSYSLRPRSHNFELCCMHDDRNVIDWMLFKAYPTV